MRCPFCHIDRDKVVDSRSAQDGAAIRRRRECLDCGQRFTTYERVDRVLRVVKKQGTREPFRRDKILRGLKRACEKRAIPVERLEGLCEDVERDLIGSQLREIASRHVGERVLEHLKLIDQVAYVRFASVYREFQDIHEFVEAMRPLLEP